MRSCAPQSAKQSVNNRRKRQFGILLVRRTLLLFANGVSSKWLSRQTAPSGKVRGRHFRQFRVAWHRTGGEEVDSDLRRQGRTTPVAPGLKVRGTSCTSCRYRRGRDHSCGYDLAFRDLI